MTLSSPQEILIEGHSIFGINWTPVATNSRVITLSYYTSIDLTPVKLVRTLERLDLSIGNKLTTLNLSPLSHCTALRTVNLAENRLAEINLYPLQYCQDLETLVLTHNRLTEVNLDPLENCPKIRTIDLSNNTLKFVDLSPLGHSEHLERLNLIGNQLSEVDISPLLNLKRLIHVELDEGVQVIAQKPSEPDLVGLWEKILPRNDFHWVDSEEACPDTHIDQEKVITTD